MKHFGLGPYFFIDFMRRITWLFFILSLIEGIRIYINSKVAVWQNIPLLFLHILLQQRWVFFSIYLGNYNGTIISDYDNYVMSIIPGVTYFALLIFYLFWKAHYAG